MDESSLGQPAELKAILGLSPYLSLDAARYEVRRLHLLLLQQDPESDSWARMADLLVTGQASASDIVAELILRQDSGRGGENSSPDAKSFEETVDRAFRLILCRTPDELALSAYSHAIASGNLDTFGLLEELLQSDEFAQISTRQPVATRYIVISIARALWGRDPTEDEITAYGEILHGQEGLDGLLRAILATGEVMVRRHLPEEDAATQIPYPTESPDYINEIYNTILLRDADEDGLRTFSTGLADGSLGVLDIVREFMNSEEFMTTALRFPTVSHHVARTVLSTMMKREIPESSINAYSGALRSGYPLQEFLLEILGSPEFKQQFGSSEIVSINVDGHSTGDLAGLAEGLLVNRMIQEGYRIPAAPYAALTRPPIQDKTMASLIRTLAMMGRS